MSNVEGPKTMKCKLVAVNTELTMLLPGDPERFWETFLQSRCTGVQGDEDEQMGPDAILHFIN